MSRIYVASSWRNKYQPAIVLLLRGQGHEVYDFRNPAPGDHGFQWSQLDPEWETWMPKTYRAALWHPIAEDGFRKDMEALRAAHLVVLLLPSGRSAHAEAAYHCGKGKPVIVHIPEPCEPELMYKMFHVITTDETELLAACAVPPSQLVVHAGLAREAAP